MEPTTSLPKWFWISLLVIALVTIVAIMYCNKKTKQKASAVADSFISNNTNESDQNLNVIDQIDSLSNVMQ